MSAWTLIARKKTRTWAGDRKLAAKCFDWDLSQRDLCNTVRRFRIGNPHHGVLQIELLLFHGSEFLVDPKSRFGNDADHIAQVVRGTEFDFLLLRPAHVMRPE